MFNILRLGVYFNCYSISMKKLLVLFIILGFIVPYAILTIFIVEYGLNMSLLLSQVTASYGSIFFAVDVILTAIFIIILAATDKGLGDKKYYVIGVSLFVGPSCALPLYYLLKQQ
jgi:hypothetical protein